MHALHSTRSNLADSGSVQQMDIVALRQRVRHNVKSS